MSAIRPLATIAMLMVLGYFLWTRINTPGLETTSEGEYALEGLPPVSIDGAEGGDTMQSAPPAFQAGESSTASAESVDTGEIEEFNFAPETASASADITPLDASDTNAMPELPPLPGSVPTAQYPDAATPPAATGTVTGNVPSLGTEVPPVAGVDTPPLPTDMMADIPAGTPLGTGDIATGNSTTADSATGVVGEFAPASSAFATARPAIDAALARGEIEVAHKLLSQWYGDRTLTAEEQTEVEGLLSQLAGSVIYSTEHRIEPPHRVQAGETLETIAQKYSVPWQLLAKINGVSQPSTVVPGQELKVIRGPFSAVVEVERQQLALMVADRYAGRFSVKTEGQATAEGEWVVMQKQMPSGTGATSKQIVLESTGGAPLGTQLVIGPASDTAPATAGAIRVGPNDQNDLFDILSIGSRVIIRK